MHVRVLGAKRFDASRVPVRPLLAQLLVELILSLRRGESLLVSIVVPHDHTLVDARCDEIGGRLLHFTQREN